MRFDVVDCVLVAPLAACCFCLTTLTFCSLFDTDKFLTCFTIIRIVVSVGIVSVDQKVDQGPVALANLTTN